MNLLICFTFEAVMTYSDAQYSMYIIGELKVESIKLVELEIREGPDIKEFLLSPPACLNNIIR